MGDDPLEPEQGYEARTGHAVPSKIKRPQNLWPESAPFWREGLYAYYQKLFPLSMKIVKIMALAFDLPENSFDHLFKFPITGMRALHYPSLPDHDETAIGLGPHTDFTCKLVAPTYETDADTPSLHYGAPRL